jgi:gentisate 1,2-dioxygenase
MFDAGFFEEHALETQPITRKEGDALARFGSSLLPLDYESTSLRSPLFTYPYSRSRRALERMFHIGPIDPIDGVKMQYVNPATGGYPMPTIAAFLQMLPAGFRGGPYRSTDGTVYAVVEGSGRTRVGSETFVWGPRDIFVVPSWQTVVHEANEEAVLFSFSDRPAQKALGLWREERADRSRAAR